jgi:cytidine deaminase
MGRTRPAALTALLLQAPATWPGFVIHMALISALDPALQELCHAALEGIRHSYSPYSKFPVSAALLAKDGRVFTGANVENASYGLTVCAERVAIWKAVTDDVREFTAIAITTKLKRAGMPCGACRQVLAEFAPDLVVYSVWDDKVERHTLRDLLPEAFTPKDLEG